MHAEPPNDEPDKALDAVTKLFFALWRTRIRANPDEAADFLINISGILATILGETTDIDINATCDLIFAGCDGDSPLYRSHGRNLCDLAKSSQKLGKIFKSSGPINSQEDLLDVLRTHSA